jgi:HSP20 family molecular chaperone IbpA
MSEEFKVKRRGPRGERLLLKKQKEQGNQAPQQRMSFKDMEYELNNLRKKDSTPKVDLLDVNDKFIIVMELPGVLIDDIKIELLDDQFILVGGTKKTLNNCNFNQIIYTECKYGNFTRRVKLKSLVKIDTIDVTFTNGVLQIILEKLTEKITIDKRLESITENNQNEKKEKEIKTIDFADLNSTNWSDM